MFNPDSEKLSRAVSPVNEIRLYSHTQQCSKIRPAFKIERPLDLLRRVRDAAIEDAQLGFCPVSPVVGSL
jgi:hypothetical protein